MLKIIGLKYLLWLILNEVKFKSLKKAQIKKSLRSFIEKYQPKEALVVNLDFSGEIMIRLTEVRCLPFYEL